ncbi:hypothetical protein [Oceanicola sp. 502str15]|uniref:hypothetical protein n=1 Tax=Oceanicola sp. 502str15 TaxID=2696061 RepID=UPI002094370B|nr:hypothetical protein [Oceanicola sp. 502str15]MCO6384615.1 hypothetical protein [Oceanicola sp. 502str15]
MTKIMWVGGSTAAGAAGGESVVDRRLLAELRNYDITIQAFNPPPVGGLRKSLNLLSGKPLYRATFYSSKLVQLFQREIERTRPDIVLISWEPFDFLAEHTKLPKILLAHNVTSDSLLQIFPSSRVSQCFAHLHRKWESRIYGRDDILAVLCLSERDETLIKEISPHSATRTILPGSPQSLEATDGVVIREVLVSGTYEWYPKRRDLKRFLEELRALGGSSIPLLWDHPPPLELKHLVAPILDVPVASRTNAGIRVGLVPDRFTAGFKLKVSHYIASNCVVASYCDVSHDFLSIKDHEIFIRRIYSANQILEIFSDLEAMDHNELGSRFKDFQDACAEKFQWRRGAEVITDIVNCLRI